MIEVIDAATVNVLIETAPIVEVGVESVAVVEIYVETPAVVEIEATAATTVVEVLETSGVSVDVFEVADSSLAPEYEIALGAVKASPTAHRELTYSDGDLTGVSIWADATKNELLMTKSFTYSGGNLITAAVTYNDVTVTKSFAYSGGNLVSVTEVKS